MSPQVGTQCGTRSATCTRTDTQNAQTHHNKHPVTRTSSVGVLDFSDRDLAVECLLQLLLQPLELRRVPSSATGNDRNMCTCTFKAICRYQHVHTTVLELFTTQARANVKDEFEPVLDRDAHAPTRLLAFEVIINRAFEFRSRFERA